MQLFTPKQYLKIDIANSFGLDKYDWDKRLEWFDANESTLLSKLSDAENPAMFYAGIKAWEDVKLNRATGYPISLDATSSGIQILSVLTGDRSAALLSNVVNSGHRQDAYQSLFQAMQRRLQALPSVDVQALTFSRNDLKHSIMTAFYGSEAIPKAVFGEGKLLQAFFETLEEQTPYVWELNKAFLAMWNPDALKYSWVLPDNFHVNMKVTGKIEETVEFMGEPFTTERFENRPVDQGRALGANITHSIDGMIVRELLRRCAYEPNQVKHVQSVVYEGPGALRDASSSDGQMVAKLWELYEKSGYLSARILEHLDSSNVHLVNTDPVQDLLDSLPPKPFRIVPVHDCFRVHPNYGNDLRRQYNTQLALVAQSNMLQFLLSQVVGKTITINKQADLAPEILDADYALS